jgi:predicted hotdog family 3-hydroxylacyl-ACP dehydratase
MADDTDGWEGLARERLADELLHIAEMKLMDEVGHIGYTLRAGDTVEPEDIAQARDRLRHLEARLDDVAQAFGYHRYDTGLEKERLSDEERAEVEQRDRELDPPGE